MTLCCGINLCGSLLREVFSVGGDEQIFGYLEDSPIFPTGKTLDVDNLQEKILLMLAGLS